MGHRGGRPERDGEHWRATHGNRAVAKSILRITIDSDGGSMSHRVIAGTRGVPMLTLQAVREIMRTILSTA